MGCTAPAGSCSRRSGGTLHNRPLDHFQQGVLDAQPHVLRPVDPAAASLSISSRYTIPAGRPHVHVRRQEEFIQDRLHVLADVTGLGQRRGVGDGERDAQVLGQGTCQVRLARTRRADQQDVGLLDVRRHGGRDRRPRAADPGLRRRSRRLEWLLTAMASVRLARPWPTTERSRWATICLRGRDRRQPLLLGRKWVGGIRVLGHDGHQ